MKKTVLTFFITLLAVTLFAQTITIAPSASVHTGAAAGDPLGFIDGSGNLDISGMSNGDLVCFDIILADFDFNFAGYEFEINFPAYLVALSENAADWQANAGDGQGATYLKGSFISGSVQFLPADANGDRVAATTLENLEGKKRIGMLWTVAGDRPIGSAGTPNAGGTIGTVCFTLNKAADCNSTEEVVMIKMSTNYSTDEDIFANDAAEREFISATNISGTFGDPSVNFKRADFNKDTNRDSLDALGAALCALNGQANCTGWESDSVADYTQALDYNCSGAVDAQDALGLARLCLGLQNRTSFKSLEYYATGKAGMLVIDNEGLSASHQFVGFKVNNLHIESIGIDQSAIDAGWALIDKREGDTFMYSVMNFRGDAQLPTVRINYKSSGEQGQIAVVETIHQTADLAEFQYSPSIQDHGPQTFSRDGIKDTAIKTEK